MSQRHCLPNRDMAYDVTAALSTEQRHGVRRHSGIVYRTETWRTMSQRHCLPNRDMAYVVTATLSTEQRHGVRRHSDIVDRTGRKEGNVLFNDAPTHFIYGYMASDIW